jgi:VanZ family protein
LPSVAPAELTPFQVILRKFAHWFEYFVLAILVLRALRRDDEAELAARTLIWTIGGVTAYAVSDEFHQMWVPERTASAIDVMIDALGGVCGVFWFYFRHRRNPGS